MYHVNSLTIQICTDYTYNYNNKKFYTALSGSNTRDNHRNTCLQKKQTLPMVETRAELEFFRVTLAIGVRLKQFHQ